MKLLGKSIAVAVLAASATGAAEARVAGMDLASGSELVFNLVNYTDQNSYVLDLGTTIEQFLANPNQSFTFNINDANFASFASAYAAGDNVTWGVSGGYSTLNELTDLDKFGFYTTSVGANPAAFDTNAADINNTMSKWKTQLVDPNDDSTPNFALNSSSFKTVADTGAYTGDTVGNDFQTALPFVAQGALGSSLFFVREKVNVDDFDTGELQSFSNTWNFVLNGNTGTLSFGPAVAAVPLPAAVWMFGAGLMAMLRANRRQTLAA